MKIVNEMKRTGGLGRFSIVIGVVPDDGQVPDKAIKPVNRGERIIQYWNIIRIVDANTSIRIRIRVIFSSRMIFVFVFGRYFQTE